MTRALLAAIAMILPSVAKADDARCVVEAAARLPRVAGLAITSSNVRPLSAKESDGYRMNPAPPVYVDLVVNAVGRETTYVFLCGETKFGMFVRPLPTGRL